MSLRRLDQTKPPPGWFTVNGHTAQQWQRAVVPLEKAWKKYTEDSAPAVNDALAQLVEWLRRLEHEDPPPLPHVLVGWIADKIEQGEWWK